MSRKFPENILKIPEIYFLRLVFISGKFTFSDWFLFPGTFPVWKVVVWRAHYWSRKFPDNFFAVWERQRGYLLVWVSIRTRVNNATNVNLGCWFESSDTCDKVEIPLYDNAHKLGDVHTWASFFLRHLANMSFMVPFWASTDSDSVPIWGACVRSHAVRRRLFVVLMTAAHISPNVFSLWMFLSNVQ